MVGLRAHLVNALNATKASCGIRAQVWAVLMGGLAIALCFVPLFNLLGYDFAFVIGLVAAFAAVDTGHGVVASARRHARSPNQRQVWTLAVQATLLSVLYLLPPLAIISLNALRVRNCSFSAGLAFYALLPLGSVLFAAPAGVLAGLLSTRKGRWLAFSLPVVSLAWAGARMYVQPPVYALDPFGGYFPGPIYDEALSPPLRLLYFRLGNVLWICTALMFADLLTTLRGPEAPKLERRALTDKRSLRAITLPRAILLTTALAASLMVFLCGSSFGFHRSRAHLIQTLSRISLTSHFQVFSSPTDGRTPRDLKLFLHELEFRYAQLTQTLQTEPKAPVTIFLFPSADSKKDLVGAGATLFTKPWRREMFIQVDGFPPTHLRHELAHIFADSFGDPIFGISLRWFPWPRLASGLVEGVAEAADYSDPQTAATIDQEARSLVESQDRIPLASIMGAGFSVAAGPTAYTLAASFSHFILIRFGPQKFQRLYRSGGDFVAAYGWSLEALETDWKVFLSQQPLNDDQKASAEERYRRPAIFKKVCARDLAARMQEAARVRTHEPQRAVSILQSVCVDDPEEPSYKLSLSYALAAAKRPDAALSVLAELQARDDLTRPVQRRVASFHASIERELRHLDEAIAAETKAFQTATEESDRRSSVARLRSLKDPRAFHTLGRVLFGDAPTEPLDAGLTVHLLNQFAHDFPDEALGPYLLGRQLVTRDPALAFETLRQACPESDEPVLRTKPTPLPPLFLRECLRLLGESAYTAGLYENARSVWRLSQAQATNLAERLRASDFLERINWAQTHNQPD